MEWARVRCRPGMVTGGGAPPAPGSAPDAGRRQARGRTQVRGSPCRWDRPGRADPRPGGMARAPGSGLTSGLNRVAAPEGSGDRGSAGGDGHDGQAGTGWTSAARTTERGSGRATASWCRSPSPVASAPSARSRCSRCANARTATRAWPWRPWAIRRPGCSASRTCSAAMPAGRPSISACRIADVGPIKVRDEPDGTTRCCSCRTSSRPATWPPRTPHPAGRHRRDLGLRPGRRSSPSAAPGCWARGA